MSIKYGFGILQASEKLGVSMTANVTEEQFEDLLDKVCRTESKITITPTIIDGEIMAVITEITKS